MNRSRQHRAAHNGGDAATCCSSMPSIITTKLDVDEAALPAASTSMAMDLAIEDAKQG